MVTDATVAGDATLGGILGGSSDNVSCHDSLAFSNISKLILKALENVSVQ